jgi:glycosyltransferase involved in cell wall biosynthesis
VLASTFPAKLDDGVPAFVLDLAEQEAVDFDVTVLTPRVPGSLASETMGNVAVERFRYFPSRWEDLADGAILDNLKARKSRWFQVVPLVVAQNVSMRRLIKSLRPDAIHAHWIVPQGMNASLVTSRVPLLVTTHGGDIYALRNPIATAIKKRVLRRAKSVSTVNAEMVARLVSWGIDPEKIHLLPMGVSLDQAAAARRGREAVPGRLLVVGRLVEKKGISVLLDALRNHVEASDWSLVIVGDGPIRRELEEAARGLPVEFLGQQSRERVLREMADASVLLLPSVSAASGDQEGLPVVLLEAAAMGSAIIASDLPGINEALTDDINGLLVPQQDARALGAAIDRVLSDSSLRARLGGASAARAVDYSLTTIGRGYREAIANMIETPERIKQ